MLTMSSALVNKLCQAKPLQLLENAEMPAVLSLVERGWQGARECSLELSRQGIRVEHLVKGRLKGARCLIVLPRAMTLIDVPRQFFPAALWARLLWQFFARRVKWVICDNERTLNRITRWCSWIGATPVLVRESEAGYRLILDGEVKTEGLMASIKGVG